MTDATVLQRNPQTIFSEVGDDIIFLHEGEGAYFSLEGVGAFIWNTLETPKTFGQVVEAILNEYDVEMADCLKDLTKLAVDLESKGILLLESE